MRSDTVSRQRMSEMSYKVEHPTGVAELLGVGKPTHSVTRCVRREVFCGEGKKKQRGKLGFPSHAKAGES